VPPGDYPRLAGLGDLSRLISGDRAHHGMPPGVDWLWLGFPESWPILRLQLGNYPDPTAPIGEAGDWWWFTIADAEAHGGLGHSGWLEQLAERVARSFVGPLATAFSVLGALPLIWTVPDYRRPPVPAFQPHYRLQFGGKLYVDESWSCRLNITSAGTLMDSAAADAAFPALWAAISAWVQRVDSSLSQATYLDFVKFNEINALGHYAHPDTVRVYNFDSPPYGPASSIHPPQVSVVVSLLTALVRGKAHRGRMFTPALAAGCSGTTGAQGDAGAATIASSATTLLNAINTAVPDHGVSIISTTGESNHVTQVAVGHAFDTMQTRRKSIPEKNYVLGDVLS